MPRSSRRKTSTKVYHIIIRGINKQDIFLDNQDYRKFLKEFERVKTKYSFDIYAYALMKNHVHMIIFDKNENMSLAIQSLNISYSIFFNKKYERTGHLFENRFKSHIIEDQGYLRNVVRYIHKNPENAGLEAYKWTSYIEYINRGYNLIQPNRVLNLFNNSIEEFQNFHNIYKKNQDYNKDYEMLGKISDEEAIEIIKEVIKENNLVKIQTYDANEKKETLKKIISIEGINKKQISRILGISRSTIERIK